MSSLFNPGKQTQTLMRWGLFFIVVTLLFTVVVGRVFGLSLSDLTRDINSIVGTNPFLGFLSQIGIFVWTATASICLLMASLLQTRATNYRFLLSSGLVSLWLGLDDVFMIHETLLPLMRVNEKLVLVSYVLVVGGLFFLHRRLVARTAYLLLIMALVCFGLSLAIDFFDLTADFMTFLEESFKFAGITFWFSYYLSVVKQSRSREQGTRKS